MVKPTVVSGMQPTGRLHVGNFLGALKNFVDLQNSGKYKCFFFIADYHSLTQDINDLCGKIDDLAASYLAVGLDPKKSTLYIQSEISEHTELAWILNTVTPFGELSRMTQFKDKSATQNKNINAGLFTYPALMAADIILYDATFVPVGDDQDQHLEFTRLVARKFNKKYGEVFIEPKPLHTNTPRVMSLADPNKKMSKSDPKGCLFIDDEPKEIEKKIKSAVTDSGSEIIFDKKKKPALSNLLLIYSSLSGESTDKIVKKFHGKGYADFKAALSKVVIDYFAPIREKKVALMKDKKSLIKVFLDGSEKAEKLAELKLETATKKIFSK